eukprot:385894-Pelagomonas_calceolata.AAC.6
MHVKELSVPPTLSKRADPNIPPTLSKGPDLNAQRLLTQLHTHGASCNTLFENCTQKQSAVKC